MRQKLLLVAAVFFGLLAFVLTYQQIEAERNKALGATVFRDLVIMAKPMARGDVIQAGDIKRLRQRRFKTNVYSEVPWEQRESIVGRVMEVAVPRDHVLEWSDLKPASRKKSGLAAIIPMEERAVSIPVDTISSVSGLINPGNNVDIIGTFRFPEAKGDQALDTITLTILQNVRILATGSDFGASGDERGGRSRGYSTVTLALTPKEAELIVFAMQKGKLNLTLRNQEETKMEGNLQSVNFRYLEKNLESYNRERAKRRHYIKD